MPLPGIEPEDYLRIGDAVGLTAASVRDLATYPEEARMTVSLAKLMEVAGVAGLSVPEILGMDPPEQEGTVTPVEFGDLIRHTMEQEGWSIAEFEERIGWEVGKAMARPHRILEIYNWDGLSAVANAVGISPWSFVLTELR